jgi:hypothetical protein
MRRPPFGGSASRAVRQAAARVANRNRILADKPASPLMRSQDLRATLQDITDLLMQMRRQQLEQEAYGMVTRLALGAALRAGDAAARAQVAARLSEPAEALLGPDIPPESPLGRAVVAEATRLAAALAPARG